MKKKCPNCGFLIKKFYACSKKDPHICSQCHAQLYLPAWIDWLVEALAMALLPLFFFLITIVPLKIAFILLGLFILFTICIDRFFKPKILKVPARKSDKHS